MFTDSSNELNKIIKNIGYRYSLTAEQAYDIARHEFEFVRDVMLCADKEQLHTIKSVNLMYLGRFDVYDKWKNKLLKEQENG